MTDSARLTSSRLDMTDSVRGAAFDARRLLLKEAGVVFPSVGAGRAKLEEGYKVDETPWMKLDERRLKVPEEKRSPRGSRLFPEEKLSRLSSKTSAFSASPSPRGSESDFGSFGLSTKSDSESFRDALTINAIESPHGHLLPGLQKKHDTIAKSEHMARPHSRGRQHFHGGFRRVLGVPESDHAEPWGVRGSSKALEVSQPVTPLEQARQVAALNSDRFQPGSRNSAQSSETITLSSEVQAVVRMVSTAISSPSGFTVNPKQVSHEDANPNWEGVTAQFNTALHDKSDRDASKTTEPRRRRRRGKSIQYLQTELMMARRPPSAVNSDGSEDESPLLLALENVNW
eukprot:CAMPEP_0197704518 /NCGR_PEP_ID=MMETSP1338-20131121/125980_1 /TAXON_ID=43686 ORGANISM="Pelagodinium beii, Strain RCC1491" /NCGR_SAMPLE_ID=MMETSP1338 /ASSEMBLY_ACC=CAM_ASM_000754 /LENGTH=343 /DNA_ID=CAMNT_0043288421 /DNA_START=272 /DNA_END=1300 /DNA_ORIENTATION=-